MGLIISATSGELQFKPKTLEIYVKSWVQKIKSSNTLSTQTNKLKKFEVQMCFKIYQVNFKLIMKESFRISNVEKNKLKHTMLLRCISVFHSCFDSFFIICAQTLITYHH